jgi:aspartate beta-hydroxylase
MHLKLTRAERWKQSLQALLVAWGDEPGDEQLDEVMRTIGAWQYPHAHGRSLAIHLIGTRDILRSWFQPFWIQAAGLFHSIYSNDVYRPKVLDIEQRSWLQSVIGRDAEQLVYLFHCVPRYRFFDAVFDPSTSRARGLTVVSESDGTKRGFELDSAQVFALLVIHMANEAEQACLANGMPGVWLARVSAFGNRARAAEGLAPPVFNDCQTLFSSEDELLLRESYGKAIDSACSDRVAAMSHFANCSKLCPWVAEPLILNAYLEILEANITGAKELSRRAVMILDQWGTAWDKRLSSNEWKRVAKAFSNGDDVERIKEISPHFLKEPRALFQRVISLPVRATFNIPPPRPDAPSSIQSPGESSGFGAMRLERYISSFADNGSDPRKAIYPDLPSQPWHDPKAFPIVSALESAYDEVKAEIIRLSDENFHLESEKIARKGSWEVSFFYERGRKNTENCSRCPTITAIIEQHETIRTQAGLIYVSRLRAGTHIAPHRGPTNLRVRCHLGIRVPEGDCGLRVAEEIGSWAEGHCIVFDDHYEHEAWNYSGEDRIVLIVDLWHPGLTPHEREILKSLHRYAFVYADDLNRYWTGNLKAKAEGLADYH